MWIRSTVAQAVDDALATFVERFDYVQDDLRGLVSPSPILAEDAVRNARRCHIRVIEVDGSRDEIAVADLVAEHFHEFLTWHE